MIYLVKFFPVDFHIILSIMSQCRPCNFSLEASKEET